MRIYPAVDIKNGQAVRLLQGRADQVSEYGDPVEAALRWQEAGARILHMVDLDGAFTGRSDNLAIVAQITKALTIPVQLGGGIRTLQDVEDRLRLGVHRVVIGTAACEHPEMVAQATTQYPDRIAVGIDARDGMAAVRGWVENTNLRSVDLALCMKDAGVRTIIYTDISRDGMLAGPNCPAMAEMVRETGMEIIASGGVGCLEDLKALVQTGVQGVIVGKSLYTGALALADALELEDGAC